MKHLIKIYIALSLFFPIFLCSSVNANAQSNSYEYELTPRLIIKDRINIIEKIDSDAILVGSNVIVDNEINGDLFVISESLKVNAKVNGDVRFISSLVTINSQINGSVSGIGSNLEITTLGEISKDTYGFFENVKHDGRIGGNLNVSPNPESSVQIIGKVLGNIYYSEIRPLIAENAFIEGRISNIPTNNELVKRDEKKNDILSMIYNSVSLIFIFILVKRLFPTVVTNLNEKLKNEMLLKVVLYGLIITFITPFLLLLLLISIIGIPIAIFMGFLMLTIFYISPLISSMLISERLFKESPLSFIKIFVSLLIIQLIFIAPYIGGIARFLTLFLAVGIVSLSFIQKKKNA